MDLIFSTHWNIPTLVSFKLSVLPHFVKAISTLTWSWLKWDQQLKKIWNLSVSQYNELDVENINWLKTS